MGAWQQQRQWSVEEPYKRAQIEKIRHEIEQDKRMLSQSEGVLRSLGLLPEDPTGATSQGGITAFPTGTTGGGEPEPFTRQPQTPTENIGGALVGQGAPGVAVTPPGQPVTPTGDPAFQGGTTRGILPDQPSSIPMLARERAGLNIAGSVNPYLPEDMGTSFYGPAERSPQYQAYVAGTTELAKQVGQKHEISDLKIGVDSRTGTEMTMTGPWNHWVGMQTPSYREQRRKSFLAAGYTEQMADSILLQDLEEASQGLQAASGGNFSPQESRYPQNEQVSVEDFETPPTTENQETLADLSQKIRGTMADVAEANQLMTGAHMRGGALVSRPPLTDRQTEEMRQLAGLFRLMDEMERASLEVNRENRAVIAPLVGIWQKGGTYIGANDHAIRLQAMREAFAGLFARLGGETGRFTEGDIARAQKMVPDLLMKHDNTVWLLNMANALLADKLIGITRPYPQSMLRPGFAEDRQIPTGDSPTTEVNREKRAEIARSLGMTPPAPSGFMGPPDPTSTLPQPPPGETSAPQTKPFVWSDEPEDNAAQGGDWTGWISQSINKLRGQGR